MLPMRSENPAPDTTTLLSVRGAWLLMVRTEAREQPTAAQDTVTMVIETREGIIFMSNVAAQ